MTHDELMVEVQKIATETAVKWIERGPTVDKSWVISAPFCNRVGLNAQTLQETIEANFPEHLHTLKGVQIGGQRRVVFCFRLDALPRVLLRIDTSRKAAEDRPLIFALQESLYEILTQKVFKTGDGERPAQAFRALLGEQTGYTLPMFPPTAPAEIDEQPRLIAAGDAPAETKQWIRAGSYDAGDIALGWRPMWDLFYGAPIEIDTRPKRRRAPVDKCTCEKEAHIRAHYDKSRHPSPCSQHQPRLFE